MAETIEFVSNYNDHSTDTGFQFEFHCDRCGTGYRTKFQPSAAGTVSNVLDGASSLFGGVFGQAANIGQRVRSAGWQQSRDRAFSAAIEEIKPNFVQCPRCQSWVCRAKCWNTRRGLCKQCAPDLAVEASAAQASRTVEEIWAHSQVAEEDRAMLTEKAFREGIRASCPNCDAPLATNAKFCPECGAKVATAAFCAECGSKLLPNAKFCPECGKKVGG
jgi:membrane protease subunit (stomatin/prohibitin family)